MGNGNFLCLDCGVDTNKIDEYYMVKGHVWTQAMGDKPDGMLCIGCLEKRIGRRLQLQDFTEHMNQHGPWAGADRRLSKRLANRLGIEESND